MSEATLNLIPATQTLDRERIALAAAISRGEQRRITDPVITPFVRALVSDGFLIKKTPGGCDALGECPDCRGRYLYTAIKDGIELRLCAHCRDAQDRLIC